MKKIFNYILRRRNRFLLLAVILSAGLTLRMAAFAKYNAYMDDFTSAIAGDFIFTSNYLFAEKIDAYQINSFNGDTYDLSFVVRNYENSLRFNQSGEDFFYTVEAMVYEDAECTRPDAAYNGGITLHYGDSTDSKVAATDPDGKKYGFLPGLANFDKDAGEQKVFVAIDRSSVTNDSRYLKIRAYSIPKQLAELRELNPNDENYDFENYSGVYYTALEAVFELNIVAGSATVTGTMEPGNDYTVRYRLTCTNSNSGNAQVKVYYNTDKVAPDYSSGTIGYDAGGFYVQTTVNIGGTKDLYFYKNSLQTTMAADDFRVERLTSAETENETEYDITITPSSNGSAVAKIDNAVVTKAKAMQQIVLQVTPNTGYVANGAAITATIGGRDVSLRTTLIGTNQYQFEMMSGPVSIEPRFRPTIQIGTTQNCTIESSESVANEGTKIILSVTPAAGYEDGVPTLFVKDASNTDLTVTDEGNNMYSFVMPATPVTVTATYPTISSGE